MVILLVLHSLHFPSISLSLCWFLHVVLAFVTIFLFIYYIYIFLFMYELRLEFLNHTLNNEWSKCRFSPIILLLYLCVTFDCHLYRWSSSSIFLTFWFSCLVIGYSSSIFIERLSPTATLVRFFCSCSYALFSNSFASFFQLMSVAYVIILDMHISLRLVNPLPPCSLFTYNLTASLLICMLSVKAIIFLVLISTVSFSFLAQSSIPIVRVIIGTVKILYTIDLFIADS